MSPPRRQRTASENENGDNGNDNVNNGNGGDENSSSGSASQQRRISSASDNEQQNRSNDGTYSNDNSSSSSDENMDATNSEGIVDSASDFITDYDEEEDDDDEYDDDDELMASSSINYTTTGILQQLQNALLNSTAGLMMNPADLDRIRQNFTLNHFGGPSTHSAQIRVLLQRLANDHEEDVGVIYSVFTEIWELIVLTGEEVEAYEFDSVVDLKGILKPLLKVLQWDEECQVYGSEFLLFAIRCTKAVVQYSPLCSKRLVDSRVFLPLLIKQLESVEYIDLAEDLIQIFLLLSARNKEMALECLKAQGIRAVLGFVDFLALNVQISAFTAAAQMAATLNDPSFISPQIIGSLQNVLRMSADSKALTQAALKTISNIVRAAPSLSNELLPLEFLQNHVIPLAGAFPREVISIANSIANHSVEAHLMLLKASPELLENVLMLQSTSVIDNNILEALLKLIINLLIDIDIDSSSVFHLKSLLISGIPSIKVTFCSSSYKQDKKDPIVSLKVSQVLLDFYLKASPSISAVLCHFILLTLLLLESSSTNDAAATDLVKMGTLTHLITASSTDNDPLTLIIALEWCKILSTSTSFAQIANRQGLLAALKTLNNKSSLNLGVSENLKTWLRSRIEFLGGVGGGSSGSDDGLLEAFISLSVKQLEDALILDTLSGVDNNNSFSLEKLFSSFSSHNTSSIESFTEYEWLGDPNSCLARHLLNHLNSKSTSIATNTSSLSREQWEAICRAIYRAIDRFDENLFKLSLPRAAGNPFDSLAIFARPLRVRVKWINNPQQQQEKLLSCDPFSCISWIVRVAQSTDQERSLILQDGEEASSVDFSSTAFKQQNVILVSSNNTRIPVEPSQSLIEVLYKGTSSSNSNSDRDDENNVRWKRLNEFFTNHHQHPVQLEIIEEPQSSSPSEPSESRVDDLRIKLALDLLASLPFTVPNESLSLKLAKELDSPLLVAVNGISSHWTWAARTYPFLFPFELRVSLFKTISLDRMRALWLLQQRLANADNAPSLVSSISLPKRKFIINRTNIQEDLRSSVLSERNRGDFRVFEFEYENELGTGHGPTMEFYALASDLYSNEHEGILPGYTKVDYEKFNLLGSLVARAWLDDRIINIPVHPVFISVLKGENAHIEDLAIVDPILANSLDKCKHEDDLPALQLPFLVPGSEGPLDGDETRLVRTLEDLEEFRGTLLRLINENLIEARDAFLQGFNSSFPISFPVAVGFFSSNELSRLFCASLNDPEEWSLQTISSALVPDHGYRFDSPQIGWLAQILSEAPWDQRIKLIRFLTGAAYLPIGGWKALKPSLTIVCKTFSTSDASNSTNVNNTNSPNNTNNTNNGTDGNSPPINASSSSLSPSSSTSTRIVENHDIYLPSVMTCANYLKLPRYSSKAVLKERLLYAVEEGSGSFYLS